MIVHFLLFSVNLEIFGKKEEKTIFLNVQLDIDSSDITNDNNKIISNVNSNSESKSENLRSKETLAKISSNDLEKEEKAKLKIAELKEEAELELQRGGAPIPSTTANQSNILSYIAFAVPIWIFLCSFFHFSFYRGGAKGSAGMLRGCDFGSPITVISDDFRGCI